VPAPTVEADRAHPKGGTSAGRRVVAGLRTAAMREAAGPPTAATKVASPRASTPAGVPGGLPVAHRAAELVAAPTQAVRPVVRPAPPRTACPVSHRRAAGVPQAVGQGGPSSPGNANRRDGLRSSATPGQAGPGGDDIAVRWVTGPAQPGPRGTVRCDEELDRRGRGTPPSRDRHGQPGPHGAALRDEGFDHRGRARHHGATGPTRASDGCIGRRRRPNGRAGRRAVSWPGVAGSPGRLVGADATAERPPGHVSSPV